MQKFLLTVAICCISLSQLMAQQPLTAAAYPFTATTKTFNYLPISATTPSALTGGVNDDGYINNIPIGFNFIFCGVTYTTVTATTNGQVIMGNSTASPYDNSSLSATPCLMPMWDDLDVYANYSTDLSYGKNISYLTEGSPGNRIFKLQYFKIHPLSSNAKALSFQIWLYENGAIEFIYKLENSYSWNATIGIARTTGDYQTLNNSGSNPTSSSTTYTSNISSAPATGQSYTWGITTRGYNNAAAAGIASPSYPFCPGTYAVAATIKNAGKNQIQNVKVYWELDGVLQPVVNYNTLIDTFGSTAGNLATVTLGNVPFTGSDRNIRVYTSVPNGIADTVNSDDTLKTPMGPAPKTNITPNGPTIFCTAGTINVKLSAPTGAGSTYQWYKDGVPIPGAANRDYQAISAGDYTVKVDSNGCSNTSDIMRVDNLAMPLPTVNPSGYPVLCSGDSVTLVANANITGASYQWEFQGAAILGATNASLTVHSPGNYTVRTSKYVCSASSPGINVTPANKPTPQISQLADGTLITDPTYVSYQWKKDNVAIPGATLFAYKPSVAGVYTVEVSNGGCSEESQPIQATTGVMGINITDGISIYPNPATTHVNVSAPANTLIVITSVEGKTLISQRADMGTIDISNMATGVYLIKIMNTEGAMIKTERLIKTN